MSNDAFAEKANTGIPGLDYILGGGLPRNRLYMLEGEGGTGKTTFGLQFCLAGIQRGERCLYISLSETEEELRQVMHSHGWSAAGLDIISFSDGDDDDVDVYTLFHPSEVELGHTTRRVLETVERFEPQRVVLDTLSGLRLLADDALRYRRQIESLRKFFTAHHCTVLIADEIDLDKNSPFQPRSLAHGVISLGVERPVYGPERRRIHVKKLRGQPYHSGVHDMRMTTGGLSVYPRLVAADHSVGNEPEELISSGSREIDQLLGKGLQRGSSTLIMGSAGTGKSSFSLLYCIAAAQRGEKSAYYIFDESIGTFYDRGRGLGMDPAPWVEKGLITLQQVDPAEMTPGEFAHNLRQLAMQGDLRLVVIDSLSGYLYAMPHERFLTLHLHELLTFLGNQQVTVLLTLIQHGLVGRTVHTPAELSFLADTLIQLRYFEAHGEVRKAISVFKKRAGPHECTIRELIMLPGKGIRVGPPLRDFQGVLTGVPNFVGSSGPDSPLFPQ